MLELLIVAAIMMVIAALAFPTITTTLATIKVRGTMSEISGLVQNCRSLAVRRSKTKSLRLTTVSGMTVMFTQTCSSAGCTANIDNRANGEDETLYLPTGFTAAAKTEAPTTLDPATIWGTSSTPDDSDIAFNPRGLPCDLDTLPCGAPRGFIKYFKYAPAGRIYWIALTVSPAGRVKNYYWNSSNTWGD